MANGLFGHIQANRARSVVLLIALFAMNFVMAYGLLLIVDGYFIRHFEGIRRLEDLMALSARHLLLYSPVVAGLTALWAFFGTWMSQSLIDMATGARSEAGNHRRSRAERLRLRDDAGPVRHHRHHGTAGNAG
jgi:heat shock protein HtpX